MYTISRNFLTAGLFLAFSPVLLAQKKTFTLEESLTNFNLAMPIRQLHGFADLSYAEVVSSPKGDALIRTKEAKVDTLLFASEWMEGKRNFPLLQWQEDGSIVALWGNAYSKISLTDKRKSVLCTLPEGAENMDMENKGYAVAFTQKNNLFVQKGSETIPISNEANPDVVFGQSVHRNEYGITKGTFWSPAGDKLAFYRMDQSMVTDYPIVDINEKPAQVRNIKYPMAGQKSHEVQIGIFDMQSRKTTYLVVDGPKDQYLCGISWTPDNQFVSVTVLNRATNHLQLRVYNATTGAYVKTLLEEKSDTYLDPQEGPLFVNNQHDFVWQSESSGFNQLYLYDWNGKLKRALSQGSNEVKSVLGLDYTKSNLVYVQAASLGLDREICMVSLAKGNSLVLSKTKGVHTPFWCDGKAALLDVWSNIRSPKNLDALNLKTGQVVSLKSWEKTNPYDAYQVGTVDTLSLKGSDGQHLQCRIIKPSTFDPKKKYPVIVYLYGGPHAQMVTNSWLAGANAYMLAWAEEGFLVFTLDNRGSDGRGVAFERAHYRRLGTPEMEDQLTGWNYLKNLSYVDSSRIGIHGWSYGGFMTTTMMTRAPGKYKVGIAGAPVIDWSMYEIMYGERYMDTPAENPAGYQLSNCSNHADKVKGKFMLIHGTADDVVVWQHTQQFLKKAISAGVQLDYFIYPGHGHGIGGKDRMHLMQKMTRYFKENL